jgi:benzoyl-CoA reductase subunit D
MKHLTAGIDAGSSAIKAAVTESNGGQEGRILALASQRIRRRNVADVARAVFEEVCAAAGVPRDGFHYVASTGDGDAVDFATGHFYGMTTHARGAVYLMPEARAVLDIGALHARAIRMDGRGKVLGHRMTSQCASGTGQFLENIARYLGVPLEDVGRLSLQSTNSEEVSSICAVLAETDVINMVSRGLGASAILRGIHLSISGRLLRLLRSAGAVGIVALTGGLAEDEGLVSVLRDETRAESGKKGLGRLEIRTETRAAHAGALGAALLGAYRFDQLARRGHVIASVSPAHGVP